MKIEVGARYKSLIEGSIEVIDETIQDVMDEYNGDLTDEDLAIEIGRAIDVELDASGVDMSSENQLKKAVKNDLILNYVRYMYSQWYTGDMEEADMCVKVGHYVE